MKFKWTKLPAHLEMQINIEDKYARLSGCAGEFKLGNWSPLLLKFEALSEQDQSYYSRPLIGNTAWKDYLFKQKTDQHETEKNDDVIVLLDPNPSDELIQYLYKEFKNCAHVEYDGVHSFWPASTWPLLSSESRNRINDIKLIRDGKQVQMECDSCPDRLDLVVERCKPFFPCEVYKKTSLESTASAFRCGYPLTVNGVTKLPDELPMDLSCLSENTFVKLSKCSMPDPFAKHNIASISVVLNAENDENGTFARLQRERQENSENAAQTRRLRNMCCAACVFHRSSGCQMSHGYKCDNGPYFIHELHLLAKRTVPVKAMHIILLSSTETKLLPYKMNELCSAMNVRNPRPRTNWRIGMPKQTDRLVVYADSFYAKTRYNITVDYDKMCKVLGVKQCETENDLRKLLPSYLDEKQKDAYMDDCRLLALQCIDCGFDTWEVWGWRYSAISVHMDFKVYDKEYYRYDTFGRGITVKYEHGRTTYTPLFAAGSYKCRNFGSLVARRSDETEESKLVRREADLLRVFAENTAYPYIPGKEFRAVFAENMLTWQYQSLTPKEVRSAHSSYRRRKRKEQVQV